MANNDCGRRIARLQGLLRDLAQWKAADANRKCDELERTRQDMIEALDRNAFSFGALAGFTSRRLSEIEKSLTIAKAEQAMLARSALEHETRARLAKALSEKLNLQQRAHDEKQSLLEAIETSLRTNGASST